MSIFGEARAAPGPRGVRGPDPERYTCGMSRMTGQGYSIARSTGRCAATGVELRPGDACVAALAERVEDEGLDRLDYSEAAWEGGARPARLFGSWRYVAATPESRRKPFIDDDALLELFERLGEDDAPRRRAFRFVLALMLIRKRLLRHEGSRGSGDGSVMLVRARGPEGWNPEDPLIEVVDPDLDQRAIGDVTEQLSQLLAGGDDAGGGA